MKTVDILEQSTFTDFAKIIDDQVVGFQVNFKVRATNDNDESKTFNIVYQSIDRTDQSVARGDCEMTTAAGYGCDEDQSVLMEDFMECDYQSFAEMDKIAESLCEKWLAENE